MGSCSGRAARRAIHRADLAAGREWSRTEVRVFVWTAVLVGLLVPPVAASLGLLVLGRVGAELFLQRFSPSWSRCRRS
jgi:hypothetical protein